MFNSLAEVMEDPKRRALLMMAAQQIAPGPGGPWGALSRGLMAGVQGYDQGLLAKDRRQQEAQERELRQLEMARTRGLMDRETRIDALGPQFMRPGAAPSLAPGDDEGNAMPSTQPRMDWRGYQTALSGIDPRQGLALQAQLAQINQREGPMKVARNERLVDPRTGRVTLDAAPDLPAGMRMGPNGQPEYIPQYVEGQQKIRAAGRQQTNVNLPPAEKAFNVELAKHDAKQIDEWRESAVKAQGGLSRIQEMKALAQQGMYSGWGASGRTSVVNFFDTLGLPFDRTKLENSQQYTKHAKELTLAMLKEGVGSTNISNADLAFVNETVPQLETNPRARLALLDYMERRLGSSVDRFERADSHAREHGGLRGFNYRPKDQERREPAGPLKKNQTALFQARQAIKAGKNKEAVIQRMREQGFDPAGL